VGGLLSDTVSVRSSNGPIKNESTLEHLNKEKEEQKKYQDYKNKKIETIKSVRKHKANRNEDDIKNIKQVIANLPVFCKHKVEDQDLRDIAQHVTYQEVQAGDYIINQGESGDKYYIILWGKTLVKQLDPRLKGKSPEEIKHFIKMERYKRKELAKAHTIKFESHFDMKSELSHFQSDSEEDLDYGDLTGRHRDGDKHGEKTDGFFITEN
jgi:cytochrome c553